jgi:hypothetical protein
MVANKGPQNQAFLLTPAGTKFQTRIYALQFLFSTMSSSAILFSTVSPALHQLTSHTSCCKAVTCPGLWFWMRNQELISGQFLKQDMLESAAAKPKSDSQASTRWWLEQWKKSFNTEPKLNKDNWDNQWGKWSSSKSANSSHLPCSQSASRSIIHFALHSHQVLHHPDDQWDPEDPPFRHSVTLLQKTL